MVLKPKQSLPHQCSVMLMKLQKKKSPFHCRCLNESFRGAKNIVPLEFL